MFRFFMIFSNEINQTVFLFCVLGSIKVKRYVKSMPDSSLYFSFIDEIHPADIRMCPAFLFDDDIDVGNVFISWSGDFGFRTD